jgi:hypothetical protein
VSDRRYAKRSTTAADAAGRVDADILVVGTATRSRRRDKSTMTWRRL